MYFYIDDGEREHPDERISHSDWFINNFMLVVNEKFLSSSFGHKYLTELIITPHYNHFTNQSELDIQTIQGHEVYSAHIKLK